MIYEGIQGWFDFEGFYDSLINTYNNALFVEIGAWKGKSTSFMAEN